MELSNFVQKLKPSSTMAIADQANEMKRSGIDVISLALGEPDFDTPEHIVEAACDAVRSGHTRYTPVAGTLELKQLVLDKFNKMYQDGFSYSLDQVIVSTGAKQVLYNFFLATINPGDEVVITSPYWVSYVDMVMLAGGVPIFVESDDDFILQPDVLESAITDKTKCFIFNSPCNPSGVCYSESQVKSLCDVLSRYSNVSILSDDIYEHITYGDVKFCNVAMVDHSLRERTFLVNGVSKAYSMTGWRIGYGVGPSNIIKGMSKLQSQSTSCPSSVSQKAACEALRGGHEFLLSRNAVFERRRDIAVKMLNESEGLECRVPNGAFYVFPSCKGVIGKTTKSGVIIKTDQDFVSYILSEYRVSAVHGSAFGKHGYFRISYATSDELLIEALNRIKQACGALLA